MSNYLRNYQVGDEEEIFKLFRETFKREIKREFWLWRFRENPFGGSIIKLMFDGDLLIGHYAVQKMPISINGNICNAALSMTTMTHPCYTGRGIFTILANEVYKQCYSQRIKIVLGFANKNSKHGLFNKLGWVYFGQVKCFELNVERRKVQERYDCSNFKCEKIDDFNEEFDKLWESMKLKYNFIVLRNRMFLTWRYILNPVEQYLVYKLIDNKNELHGYMVLKLYKGERELVGQIIDILTSKNEETFSCLINEACRVLSKLGASRVVLWAYLPKIFSIALEKLGFQKKEWTGYNHIEWPTFAGIKLIDANLEKIKGIKNVKNWYITMGDSDVF